MLGWAGQRTIALAHIQPRRPMQNGQTERIRGRLRDECLNAHGFGAPNDVRTPLTARRWEYNCERPDSSLGYRTSDQFRRTTTGDVNVERNQRFPHSYSLGGEETISTPNPNRESPVMNEQELERTSLLETITQPKK